MLPGIGSFARVLMWKFVLTMAIAIAPGGLAHATTPLDRYLDDLSTLRASFTQKVVDSRGRTVDESTGTLLVQRPGRFRWEVQPAGGGTASDEAAGQLLVADGKNLWFFDRDLEQVTVKPAAAALTATPAMLLSGGSEVREAFRIELAEDRNGLSWVRVVPVKPDADFREALFGFARGELRRLELHDKLGQTALLSFDSAERNVRVDPALLRFTPPPGADVIGTPAS